MKILILTHEFLPYPGGVATYCAEIANAASALGHDVTVLAPNYESLNHSNDRQLTYKVKRFKGSLYSKKSLFFMFVSLLSAKPWRYDIVHSAEIVFLPLLNILNRLSRLRFRVTVHGTDIQAKAHSKFNFLFSKMFNNTDYVIANSNFTAGLVRQHHSYLENSKILSVPLSVSSYWFESTINIDEKFKRLEIPLDKKILLTVARLDTRKGQDKMLLACKMLPPAMRAQLAYVVVGKPVDLDYLEKLKILASNLDMPVIFTGPLSRDEIRALYAKAWLFCMPNSEHPIKVEGFGLAYLEAAAQGLPSLATPLGGVPEVVLNGETGVMVAKAEPELIKQAIHKLLEHPNEINTLKVKALKLAKLRNWTNVVTETYIK